MYVPAHFAAEDSALVDELIDGNPFATLVSQSGGEPFASHLPLLRERRGDALVLLGHFARANPHWRALAQGEPALAIFHGPHAYVSPRWYRTPTLVPTWNYAAIHCTGRLRIFEDRQASRALLVRLAERFESDREDPWTLSLEPALEDSMLRAIVAFEFEVGRVEAKLKLSQNRSAQDRAALLEAMAREADESGMLRELHGLSLRVLEKP